MRGKGLPEHLITGAINEAAPVWAERAQGLRRRRFGVEPPGTLEERARQSRFLLYRGFTPAQVRMAFVVDRVDLEDLDLDADMPEDSAHVD
jgi:regulatory protein